jgi:glutaconate CoA-transferase subunit B
VAAAEGSTGPTVSTIGLEEPPVTFAEESSLDFTTDEMMTVAASRLLNDGQVCFVGIGLPSTAANLARLTHAPNLVLIYESGAIGAKPTRLPLSIGDGELAETADLVVSVPEIFNYWLQGGHIDVGFLSAAQIDRYANLNSTVVGSYDHPRVRLPGAGGAPEIAASCREVIIVIRQSRRAFVKTLDFITSVGHGSGPGSRERMGFTGMGPVAVITDFGILRPHPETRTLEFTHLHPGVAVEDACDASQWRIDVSSALLTTDAPRSDEIAVLRRLESTMRPS